MSEVCELVAAGEDGRTLYYEIKKSAVRDEKNHIIGITGIVADVTKRVLLEKKDETAYENFKQITGI